MKRVFRFIYLNIAIFVVGKLIMPILDIIDALYARRKYKRLIKDTEEMFYQYTYTKNLFFRDGGYKANKDIIAKRAGVLKQNAESVSRAIKILNSDWAGFFSENSRKVMDDVLKTLEEIKKFGEENCQIEST